MPPIEMLNPLAVVFAAVIGAGLGALFSHLREKRRIREHVVTRYLLQLQDAIESLWFRLANVKYMGGRKVMESNYYEVSTLYAMGSVLAYKRIFLLDGVYHQLEHVKPGLGLFLKTKLEKIDNELARGEFYRYDRLALGEAVMEREKDYLRTSTYREFMQRYKDINSMAQESLKPAKDIIATFEEKEVASLMNELVDTAEQIATETKIPPTIKQKVTVDSGRRDPSG